MNRYAWLVNWQMICGAILGWAIGGGVDMIARDGMGGFILIAVGGIFWVILAKAAADDRRKQRELGRAEGGEGTPRDP